MNKEWMESLNDILPPVGTAVKLGKAKERDHEQNELKATNLHR